LGYSLMHATGAALDNPELVVACVVGVLTVALFDDGAAAGLDDEEGLKAPRQDVPGGAFVVMVAA
jgi:hypothetical protein